MKFNININQKGAIDAGLKIDLIDLAVFDFIKDFIHSGSCQTTNTIDGMYFWVSHKAIQKGLPLLKINTRQGIVKRINNLVDAGLLVRHVNTQKQARSLYKIGPKYECLIFADPDNESYPPDNESLQGCKQKLSPPDNESLQYNSINNNTDQLSILMQGAPDFPHSFKDNPLYEFNNFSALLKEAADAGVDLDFYYAKIKTWAEGKKSPQLRVNWKGVCVSWLQRDRQNNKLVMVQKSYEWDH